MCIIIGVSAIISTIIHQKTHLFQQTKIFENKRNKVAIRYNKRNTKTMYLFLFSLSFFCSTTLGNPSPTSKIGLNVGEQFLNELNEDAQQFLNEDGQSRRLTENLFFTTFFENNCAQTGTRRLVSEDDWVVWICAYLVNIGYHVGYGTDIIY